jgi:zinc protease
MSSSICLGFWRRLCCLWALTALVTTAQAGLAIEHWTQANGVQVYLVRSDSLPMLDVQVDIDAGERRVPAGQTGLAGVTAMMMGKGIQGVGARPAMDENALVEAWADLGAEFGVNAGADRMSFRLRTLTRPDVLNGAVALAAQQLAAPSFAAEVWQRESARLSAAWREAQTRPSTLADRTFQAAVHGNHPYGREASPETWGAIGVEAMRDFYRRHAQLCDARVTLVGAIDRPGADALVARLLAGWTAHGCSPRPPVAEVLPLAKAHNASLPFAGAAQAQIWIGQPGFPRSDPDFLVLTLGNHILGGGGFTSRLTQELREKRGLTYGVFSFFSPGRHAGAFAVSMQTRPDQAQQAVELIHAEIRRFVQDGPTEQELAEAKASLIQGFALRLDSNRKWLDNVAALAWNGLPLDYLDTWTQKIDAISAEQVRQAFQRVLQPERMVTVVVGGAAP